MTGPDLTASVRARLLNKAKAEQQDFNLVLTRYALERLLYRLGRSTHAEHFLLKGALLFDLWFDIPHRPTRDADLLGFGSADIPRMEAVFRDLCAAACEPDDGIRFQAATVSALEIRKEANYAGLRVTLVGLLAGARCPVQVDVGFGDAVTPAPELVDYPAMLPELPGPRLRAYPRYTVVAEKLEALVSLGIANSRMKDDLDHTWRSVGLGPPGGLRRGYPDPGDPRDLRPTCNPAAQWRTLRSYGRLRPGPPEADLVAGIPQQERARSRAADRCLGSASRIPDALASRGADRCPVVRPLAPPRRMALTTVWNYFCPPSTIQSSGLPHVTLADIGEQTEKHSPVAVSTIDVLTPIAPRGDVIQGVWELDSDRTCHAVRLTCGAQNARLGPSAGRVRCVDRAPPAFVLGPVRTADPTLLAMEILLDEQP